MKATVIGLGLIGGSVALEMRAHGFATRITGVDADPANADLARELKLVDQVVPFEEGLADADFVVLAVPVSATQRLLPDVLTRVPPRATVTDMGSTKKLICEAVEKHPKRAQYVAAHPMAGTEFSGPRAAHLGLFADKAAVICEGAKSGGPHLERVENLFRMLRMRIVAMGASEHDLHAAYVSHLSHVSSFVLANTVLAKERDVNTIFDLASGGFESTVRLAKSSPEMWTPIFEQNRDGVLEALEAYILHLQNFHQSLSDRNFKKTHALMEEANGIRRVLGRMGQTQGEKK